ALGSLVYESRPSDAHSRGPVSMFARAQRFNHVGQLTDEDSRVVDFRYCPLLLEYGAVKANQRSTNRTADIQAYVMLLRDIHNRVGFQRASNFRLLRSRGFARA